MPPKPKNAKLTHAPVEPVVRDDSDDDESDSDDATYPKQHHHEEEEEETPPDETQLARLKRLKRSRVNDRRKARQNGFRAYAQLAGAGIANSFGNDMTMNILSSSDVGRLAKWCPQSGDVHMPLDTFETHLALRDESLSSGPLNVLTSVTESFARKVVHELVLRNVESGGSMTITAANVKSVLRPLSGALHSDGFNVPAGLVRLAQQTPAGHYEDADGKRVFVEDASFLLPVNEDDTRAIAEERKFAKVNHVKRLREKDKTRESIAAERKKKRFGKEAATSLATGVVA